MILYSLVAAYICYPQNPNLTIMSVAPSHSPFRSRGSCLCGAVTYTLSESPQKSVLCHCINCKKISGSAFLTNDWYPAEALEVEATPQSNLKTYADKGLDLNKGQLLRHFCGNCGSPLYTKHEDFPDFVIVTRGTNDGTQGREHAASAEQGWEGDLVSPDGHRQAWKPTEEYFTKRRMDWVPSIDGSKTFTGMTTKA